MKHTNQTTPDFLTEDTCALIAQWDTVKYVKWVPLALPNNSLEELEKAQKYYGNKIIFALPFCSARRENIGVAHGDENILAFAVTEEQTFQRDSLIQLLPDTPIQHSEIQTDVDDATFMKQVESIQSEIQDWEVCQTVLSRNFQAQIQNLNNATYLSIYKKLLELPGWYMTFLMQFWNRIISGASPEVHLRIENDYAYKSPLAGTIPKKSPDELATDILDFLGNKKEQDELSMVTDEELKMLVKICESGKISGPFLKEIGKVIHTWYRFRWKLRENMTPINALRHTLFSPTIVWGPIESAFKQICTYESKSRWYYGTAVWVVEWDFLDTAIPIRTAQIQKDTWEITVRAWAWIIAGSDPFLEAEETRNKALWFLGVFEADPSIYASQLRKLDREAKLKITQKLRERNKHLSRFHTQSQTDSLLVPQLKDKSISIIHSGDDFWYNIQHMLETMWMHVEQIKNTWKALKAPDSDYVLLWPWYWDINNTQDQKMQSLLELVAQLKKTNIPTIWICLWHQAICKDLWHNIKKLETLEQWIQKKIPLNWEIQQVWSYNSYSPLWETQDFEDATIENGRVLYQKTGNCTSVQFHPESIMSESWFEILRDMLLSVTEE